MNTRNYDIERNISFSVLSQDAKNKINEAAFTILETIGMRVTGERILARFAEKGLKPDGNGVILIPRALVQWALEAVPHELTFYNIAGDEMMKIDRTNRVYFGTHADQFEIVDYGTNRARPFTVKDTELMCKLASNLPNFDFLLTVGLTKEVPAKIQSQVSFIETCKYMEKVINFSTNDIDSLQEIIDIAAMIAGGADKLAAKPFVFNYCEPIPPLTHPIESTEKLFISAENMIPVVYMPYCMMGGTSPMDRPATLAQCFAEILAGVVISQLAREGAPFIAGSMPSIIDMKTTIGSYAAPEFHLMVAASSEMADYYDLPFYGTAGCSDAKSVDPQSMSEVSYELLSTLLSKANLIHDVGVLDHCNSVSPAVVVLADELISAYKSFVRGVPDGDVDLALITEVGHAGNHLATENTLLRFGEVWYPEIFSRRMVNLDESDILAKVEAKIDRILEDNPGSKLPPDILQKLDILEKKYYDIV